MIRSVLWLLLSVGGALSVVDDKSWRDGRSTLVSVTKEDDTCPAVFSCKDCSTARLCRPDGKGGFALVQTIPCTAATPYCDYSTGSCTVEPDPSCGAKDETFVCLADGHYPDSDCKIYHVCKGLTSSKFNCTIQGQNYDADTQACEPGAQCGTFKCDATGKKVAHSLYPSYYAYCKAANAPALIDHCPGNYEMNVTSQTCEPICHVDGVQQDLEDCTKYYKCHTVWLDQQTHYMVKDRMSCPPNTGFDPTNFICVSLPSPNLPNCKPK